MSVLIVQISSSLAHTRPSKTSLCIFTCLPNIQLKAFTMEQNPYQSLSSTLIDVFTWAWLPLLLTSVSSYPLLQTKIYIYKGEGGVGKKLSSVLQRENDERRRKQSFLWYIYTIGCKSFFNGIQGSAWKQRLPREIWIGCDLHLP